MPKEWVRRLRPEQGGPEPRLFERRLEQQHTAGWLDREFVELGPQALAEQLAEDKTTLVVAGRPLIAEEGTAVAPGEALVEEATVAELE